MDETRVVLDGLGFPESTRWHEGRIWLCNWGAGEVLAVDPDGEREVVTLGDPRVGMYLPGSVWRELRRFSPGAVCLVLASERYDPAVYQVDGDVLEANSAQLGKE